MGRKYRVVYTYSFRFQDLLPLIEFQEIAAEECSLGVFMSQPLMGESLIKAGKGEAGVMAEAAGEASAKKTRGTYVLTYYNPETQKAELLEAKRDVRITDFVTRMIEESVGIRSVYPLYSFIGTPIVKQEVVLWRLEQILAEREYGTPPPSGSSAPVMPVRVRAQKKSEIAAIRKHEEEIMEAVAEAIIRKEKSELKIGEEVMILDGAVESLRKGGPIENALRKLPPLSRARYLVALRKGKLSRQTIIAMLAQDSSFLKKVKKKLETFTLEDLLNMVRMLRGLRKPTS